MVFQQPLIRQEASDQVLGGIGPVHSNDQLFRTPDRHLGFELADRRRFAELPHRVHVDGDRVRPNPNHPTSAEDGSLSLDDAQSHQLDATSQEVVHVEAGLETDDVIGQEALENPLPHRCGEHLHVSRFGPWNMDEVLHRSIGQG